MRKARDLLVITLIYVFAFAVGFFFCEPIENIILKFFVFDSVATVATFVFSVLLKNSSVYDAYWSLTPMFMSIWLFAITRAFSPLQIAFLVIFNIWSLRLTINWITVFTDFTYEDWRYRKYREETPKIFWPIVNFFGIHYMPTIVVFLGMLPLFEIVKGRIGVFSLNGMAVMLLGIGFEFFADSSSDIPVASNFLSRIMEKVVVETIDNPFFAAYKADIASGVSPKDPIILNYELLRIPDVRNTIVQTIIEAIVRYKLIITPREFLDFLYSIIVYPHYDEYKEKKEFFEALLPSLLYCGSENMIQKAISKLDPLKQSSTEHDKQLSVLFTSYSIPPAYLTEQQTSELPSELLKRTNEFYANNGRDIERTTKFVFRLKHLLSYHTESEVYKSYLALLKGIFNKDVHKMKEIYDVVAKAIPRHYGSYYEKSNMVPLNIQGGRYRLFGSLQLKPEPVKSYHSESYKNEFLMRFDMSWKFPDKPVLLRMDFQLYSYLNELNRGKLALSYENEKDLTFSRFVRRLVEKCNCEQEITVVRSDTGVLELSESSFGDIQLQ